MRKVVSFIGTRPEAIKMAPVIKAVERTEGLQSVVVSTGQHREMLEQVVRLFELRVDRELAVMRPNQTLAELTASLLTAIDATLVEEKPDIALVQGDTTTVLAATLACFYRGIRIGHVEAGLRTGNLLAPFPEEANRVLAGRLVSLHFAPTEKAQKALLAEGVPSDRIWVTGNTVIDALHMEVERQRDPAARAAIDDVLVRDLGKDFRERPYVLVTGHRRESFGQGFENICEAIRDLAAKHPSVRFIYPVHLNPNVQRPVRALLSSHPNVVLLEPQPYDRFVALLSACRVVLTDSGGVQEEAPGLGKPVLVMRETTERPEGVEAGVVKLVGTSRERIVDEVTMLLTDAAAYRRMSEAVNPYGDGKSGPRIAKILAELP